MQNLPETQKDTDSFYNNTAETWTGLHSIASFWEDQMNKFQELLPHGIILEIGAGGGRDAYQLIKRGYDYLGIEPSEGLIKVAQRNNPDAAFENTHVEEITYENKFTGFWASASLLHHPKDKIDFALQKINMALIPGAIGFISLKKHVDGLPDERVVSGKLGDRFFSFWTENDFTEVLKRNGFELAADVTEKTTSTDTWLVFLVRKLDL